MHAYHTVSITLPLMNDLSINLLGHFFMMSSMMDHRLNQVKRPEGGISFLAVHKGLLYE